MNNKEFAQIRFAPNVLSRLGEELIPDIEQGILELIKNSYDADATLCKLNFEHISFVGGRLTIEDNGLGMDNTVIKNNFFVVGRSSKVSERKSNLNRNFTGDKGLGRLAALRLGSTVTIYSRPANQIGTEYITTINWNDFNLVNTIDDIKVEIYSRPTAQTRGTTIVIDDLRMPFTLADMKRLSRECLMLCNPFGDSSDFSIDLYAKEYGDLINLTVQEYLSESDYRLESKLNEDGSALMKLFDSSNSKIDEISYPTGTFINVDVDFKIWVYLMGGTYYSAKKIALKDLRSWLGNFGGVHIYYNLIRIKPYGDPGNDWLDMNKARAKSPEERPSTNTVIGRMLISDDLKRFKQPTNRSGFSEGELLHGLRRFGEESLTWMSKVRMQKAKERREKAKKEKEAMLSQAQTNLKQTIAKSSATPKEKETITKSAEIVINITNSVIKEIKEDLQLYRTVATTGISSSVFAHEAGKYIESIKHETNEIEIILSSLNIDPSTVKEHTNKLNIIASTIEVYTDFPTFHLKAKKRRSGLVNIKSTISAVMEVFSPILKRQRVEPILNFCKEDAIIQGSVALIESIITNLLTNSIAALNRKTSDRRYRVIDISVEVINDNVMISHKDSGPGIFELSIDDIWKPGVSTTEGTGFGLTIVKDSVNDLSGEIIARADSSIGGAEFIIALPNAIRR